MGWASLIGVVIGGAITYFCQLRLEHKRNERQGQQNLIILQFMLCGIILDCIKLLDKYCVTNNKIYQEKKGIDKFSTAPLDEKFPNLEKRTVENYLFGIDKDIFYEITMLLVCINKGRINCENNVSSYRTVAELEQTSEAHVEMETHVYDFHDYIDSIDEIMQEIKCILDKIRDSHKDIQQSKEIHQYIEDIHSIKMLTDTQKKENK